MNSILQFENVSKVYPNGTKALNDINISMNKAELVAVIGPSGSGKSTLLRSINRLNSISQGTIFVKGEKINNKKGSALRLMRREIGMIFQNYNLVYSLPVIQNVLHGCLGYMSNFAVLFGRYKKEDRENAYKLLEEMQLNGFEHKLASELSGGQKQRVGIARALMQHPSILLCDEPIASLDPFSARVIMEILRDITNQKDLCTIVNLHQVEVAKKYADRIIGLNSGRIVFDGKPSELTDYVIEKIYNCKKDDLIKEKDDNLEVMYG